MEEIEGYINFASTEPPKNYRHLNGTEQIKIPNIFLNVILKSFPEFDSITTEGYEDIESYKSVNFQQENRYRVEIKIYTNVDGPKKNKSEYEELINDYFKMTYPDMDFILFNIHSLIIPPKETNRDKFLGLFCDM